MICPKMNLHLKKVQNLILKTILYLVGYNTGFKINPHQEVKVYTSPELQFWLKSMMRAILL